MNTITLHRAARRNDGRYADAGATLVVGDADDQINADRAQELADSFGGALDDPDGDILDQLTVAELRDAAEKEGADLKGATLKADILTAVRENRAAKATAAQ